MVGRSISIHALLAESDVAPVLAVGRTGYFYPRSPCGERPYVIRHAGNFHSISIHALLAESDFFNAVQIVIVVAFLSTLSLRRATQIENTLGKVINHFYPRSPCGERQLKYTPLAVHSGISIHALLAESDGRVSQRDKLHNDFYPRSPCGERQRT